MRHVHPDVERVIECTLCSGSARLTSIEMQDLERVEVQSADVDLRASEPV